MAIFYFMEGLKQGKAHLNLSKGKKYSWGKSNYIIPAEVEIYSNIFFKFIDVSLIFSQPISGNYIPAGLLRFKLQEIKKYNIKDLILNIRTFI